MDIAINSLNFQFKSDNSIDYVQATFSGNANGEYINAQLKVTVDDLNGKSFTELTTAQLQEAAGSKLRNYISNAFPTTQDSVPTTPESIKVDDSGTITAK